MKLMLVKAGQWREHLLLPLNHRKMGRAKMDRSTRKEFEQVWNSIDKVLRRVVNLEDDNRYLETQNKRLKDEISKIIEKLARHSADIVLLGNSWGDTQNLIYEILRSLSKIHPDNFKRHPMDEYIEESTDMDELNSSWNALFPNHQGTLVDPQKEKGGEYKEFMNSLTDKEKLEHNPDEFKHLSGESDTKSEDDKK